MLLDSPSAGEDNSDPPIPRPPFCLDDPTAVDSSGMAGLLRVRHAVTDAGVAFRVSDASPALRRVAELAAFQALLPDE